MSYPPGSLAGMTLAITPLDPANTADLEAYCEVADAMRGHDWPGWRELTPHIVALQVAHQFPDNEQRLFVVCREGKAVGRVAIQLPLLENLQTAEVDIWVVPSQRRQGIGAQLWDFAQGVCREEGRTRVLGTTLWTLPGIPAPDEAGRVFAQARGFKPSLVDVARRLDLSTVDESVLDAMSNPAEGYRVVRWVGAAPEEYLADLGYLEMRLHTDAPQGDIGMEPPKPDVERMRAYQTVSAKRGRVGYHTGVLHEATQRLVAWTLIVKEKSLDWHAFQQITIVDPDHRGHRLGALVKAENLRFFRAAQPTVTMIDTFNAQSNSYMIAINEQMGFRPFYAWQNWQREI